MKKVLIFLLLVSFYGNSQEFRSYVDYANEADKICAAYAGKGFYSDKAANEALDKILSTIGASKRFVLSSCENIPNAMAISLKGIRYIFYNREFMSKINSYTNYWSNMSILAHEVGHHINGHTTDALLIINDVVDTESLPERRRMELEADEFSGFVLAKLGATLAQASEAIALVASDEDDSYSKYPSKSKRIAAITKGYNKAKTNVISYEKTSSSTVEEYLYSGYIKSENGDHSGAIADYTKCIELSPYYARAYFFRGFSKNIIKDYNSAIEDFTDAIKFSFVTLKKYHSIEDFTKAKQYSSFLRADAYYNRGFSKAQINDHSDAIADYTKCIEHNHPDSDKCYFNRAVVKGKLDDMHGACTDFKIADNMGFQVPQEILDICY